MAKVKAKKKKQGTGVKSFAAKDGSHLSDVDATIIGTRLLEIEARDGTITREAVVREAKKKSSSLHKFFEWDVKKAAEKHWLARAGYLIRSVEVVFEEYELEDLQIRLVHSVRTAKGEREYITTPQALSDVNDRARVLAVITDELRAVRRKAQIFTDLCAAIDKALAAAAAEGRKNCAKAAKKKPQNKKRQTIKKRSSRTSTSVSA